MERRKEEISNEDAEGASRQTQCQTFREQLTQQPAAARAEGTADGDLGLARCAASQ